MTATTTMTRADALAEGRKRWLWWGAATSDDGIFAVRRTRREAVAACGFATRTTRERSGAFYIYTTEENNQAIVGKVGDLIEEGFGFPEEAAFADADRRAAP